MTLTGAAELKRTFAALKKKGNAAIRKGSRAASKIIREKAKWSAPFRTGKLQEALKVRALPRSRLWVGTQVVFEFADKADFYGGFVEYGTKHNRALYFYHHAADSMRCAAMNTFRRGIQENLA